MSSIEVYGKMGSELKLEKGTQLFFARCWKCSKYDWRFGNYTGWNLCHDCLNQKLTENGILSKKEEKVNAE